jgi:threonylcarbamoyladenosine tRNA methylthiotransferase MtaB
MKRRHSREQAIELVARLKSARPEITIGADLIAGFPTETDSAFAYSLDIIDQCQVVHGHIFPYSPKKGTPAALMPQVNGNIIKERAQQLRAKITEKQQIFKIDLIGSAQKILAERGGKSGYAENFAHIRLDRTVPEGQIIPVTVAAIEGDTIIGKPL